MTTVEQLRVNNWEKMKILIIEFLIFQVIHTMNFVILWLDNKKYVRILGRSFPFFFSNHFTKYY